MIELVTIDFLMSGRNLFGWLHLATQIHEDEVLASTV